jgi:type IX secretion system substrate protein
MKTLLPFIKKAGSVFLLTLLFAFVQKSFGQAASATWNPNSSITPSFSGNITAATLSSGNGSLGSSITGSYNNSTYGIGGTGWSTNGAAPAATSNTYVQFQITPNSGYSFSLSSLTFNVASNDGNDRLVVYWSTSPTFSTSATLGSATGWTAPYTFTASSLTGISAAAGQTLYIRVVFYFISGGDYVGVKSNFVATGTTATTNSITTGTITGSPFCVTSSTGASVSVPFTSTGTYTSNTYTAQLSDASGNFPTTPTVLGTLVSNANSGTTISGTIPANTATGAGYLIRVISSNPAVTGSNSSSVLTINLAANSIASATAQNINTNTNGTALSVTEQSTASSRQWYYSTTSGSGYTNAIGTTNSTTYTPNFPTAGTYYVVCKSTFSCATVTSNEVQIVVVAPAITTSAISGSPFCVTSSAGASVSVPFTSTGTYTSNTYTAQLSDASGNFPTSPTVLGTLVSNANSGTTISGTIPAGTATGTAYKIRVVSSSPSVIGSNSSSAITINLTSITNSISPNTAQTINTSSNGTTLAVSETPTGTSRQWYYSTTSGSGYTNAIGTANSTTYTPNFLTAGTYYVVCISTNNCASVTSNEVKVIVVTPTITTTSPINGSPFCVTSSSGASVSVLFSSVGVYSGTNTYTAQLSNASGVFPATPVTLGTLTNSSANSGTISGTIPAGTANGTGYLIRVVSSSPAVTGSNSAAVKIYTPANSIAPIANQAITQGVSGTMLTVTEASGIASATSRQWYYSTTSGSGYTNAIGTANSTTYTPIFSAIGTYYIVCTSVFPCGTVTSNEVKVTVGAFVSSTSDNFRSNASADWATISTWQGSHDGTNWYTATAFPTSSATSIAIQNSNNVTITTSVTSKALTISTGTLSINSGGNLTNTGTITGATISTLLVNNGGTYTHSLNGGSIPIATWNTGSTCIISAPAVGNGNTNSAPGNLSQSFYHFTWSSNLDQNYVDLNSALTTINGTFTFSSSSFYSTRLATNSSLALTIGGDFVINGGGTLRLSDGNSNPIVNVGGNFTMSNGSELDFGQGSGFGTMYVKKIVSISGSASVQTEVSSTNGVINFNGTTQGLSASSGDVSSVNFNINSGSVTTLSTGLILSSGSAFTVASGGTLVFGNNAITDDDNTCSFAAQSGSTVQLGSPYGIVNSTPTYNHIGGPFYSFASYSSPQGNVILNYPNTHNSNNSASYSAGANYVYNGTVAQATGNALPVSITGSVNIYNSFGVTLSQATSFGSTGQLLLTNGQLVSSSSLLTMNNGSAIVRDAGLLSAAPTFNATVNVSYSSLGMNTLTQTTGFELPTSATALGNLTINKTGANITLGSSATVNGTLFLTDGLFTTSSTNLMKLSSTASVTMANSTYATTSYVNGPLQRTGTGSFTFPVGKSGTGYVPAGIFTTASQTFTAEYFKASALTVGSTYATGTNLKKVSTCDYWRLDLGTTYPSNVNSSLPSGANVTLYWNPNNSCDVINNLPTLTIAHYSFTNGWDVIGSGAPTTTGNTSNGSISFAGATTFSPFALGTTSSTSNPLPIILDYFTATKAVGYNKIAWKAECTSSSSVFEVERSYDGSNFASIDVVNVVAASDCSVPSNYNDYSSTGSKSYYRLKMVDVDGNITYSNVELILNSSNALELISVQPNPVMGDAVLKISASATQNIELSIMSIDGKEVQHKILQVQQGSTTINLQTSMLAKGMYIVRGMFGNGQTNTIKFIKQ